MSEVILIRAENFLHSNGSFVTNILSPYRTVYIKYITCNKYFKLCEVDVTAIILTPFLDFLSQNHRVRLSVTSNILQLNFILSNQNAYERN